MFRTMLCNATRCILVTAVLALSASAGSALAQDVETLEVSDAAETRSLLAQAESLLAGGDYDRAYALLVPHELELAGSPYFDYLLGVAALDAGRRSEAIFSLRRSVAVEPRFSGARMELARAYYETGNSQLARPMFVSLLDENPPPGVRNILQQYIDSIDSPAAVAGSAFSGFVETFVGHDSNANASGDEQFLGFTLSPNNVETSSPFAEVAGGFNWTVPRSSRLAWLVKARAGHRSNTDASFMNATLLNGYGGMNWQRGDWFGRAGVDAYWASRDGNANESYAGFDLLFGRQLSEAWDISLGLRGGAQRYDESIEVLDVNRFLYTLGLAHRFSSLARLNFEVMGGTDSEEQTGSPYGNSKIGGRISLSAPLGNASYLHASIGSLTTDYDGLFFGVPRKDREHIAMLQLEFRDVLTDGLSFVPLARYIDNESDLSLYAYDRTEIGLIIRWAPR